LAAQKQALKKLSKGLSAKGFRKGNIPPEVARKEIGGDRLKQEAANQILESGVLQLFKEKKYNILGLPQLDATDTTKKTTWAFTLSLPLNPKIKLGEYKKTIKAILQKTKDKTKDQKVSAIADALIKKIPLVVPAVLIEREVNHSLSRLVQQTETLNLDLNTYLKSIGKTAEQVKEEYFKKAESAIKIDLILSQIAQDLKIKVDPKEIEDFALASNTPPERYNSLAPVIIRRKTLDQLLAL